MVGLLIGTPGWAGDGSPAAVPGGLDLPSEDPNNLWAEFTRQMAQRYRGRIDDWVIWNEPDIWDSSSPVFTWAGTPEQFYRLQKVAYLAIKQGNPSARVALPGLTYWWDAHFDRPQYFDRILQLAERDPQSKDNNWFFDAAVLHLYNEPEGLPRAPRLFQDLMGARGLTRPIWINETNVAPWDDPANPLPRSDFRATLDEQASYVIQAFAYALVAGVEHVSIYPFVDGDSADGEQMGMVRRDGSTRPAYRALQTATRYLAGVREGRIESDPEKVKIVLQQGKGSVTVAWSASPRPASVQVDATAERALLVDKLGNARGVSPVGGKYLFDLAPATANTVPDNPEAYPIGGSPLLLVQPWP